MSIVFGAKWYQIEDPRVEGTILQTSVHSGPDQTVTPLLGSLRRGGKSRAAEEGVPVFYRLDRSRQGHRPSPSLFPPLPSDLEGESPRRKVFPFRRKIYHIRS